MWAAIIAAATWLLKLIFGGKPDIVKTSHDLGVAEQKVTDLQQEVKAQSAVAQAVVNAPDTADKVADSMEAGTF